MVLAHGLDVIERLVRTGKQLGVVRTVLGCAGNADAGADLAGPAGMPERLAQCPAEIACLADQLDGRADMAHEHQEFVTTDPSQQVAAAEMLLQLHGQIGQHGVAEQVTKGVVDVLEVVDVDDQQRVMARVLLQAVLDAGLDGKLVQELGQVVGLCLADDTFLLALLLVDAGDTENQPVGSAVVVQYRNRDAAPPFMAALFQELAVFSHMNAGILLQACADTIRIICVTHDFNVFGMRDLQGLLHSSAVRTADWIVDMAADTIDI